MEALALWILAGCVLGVFTGLMPGIHVNTVSLIALSFAGQESLGIALMIVAMAIVHSFVDFVPSILVGVPDSESFLSLLPGHRMFAKGKALLAIKLTVVGGMAAGLLALLLAPFFFLFFSKTIGVLAKIVPFALMLVLGLMVFSEKKRWHSIIVIALSAVLGLMVLDSGIGLREPLFPLITGFFGTSSLVHSLLSKHKTIQQETGKHSFSLQKVLFGSALGVSSGMIVAVLPSIGSSQAAFIVKSIAGKIPTATYLIVLGGIGTANTIFAFFALFALGKTRSGTAAAVRELIETNEHTLALIAAAIITAIGFGALATIIISRFVIKKVEKIDYKKMNLAVLLLLVLLTVLISGLAGLVVMLTAGCIGLTAVFSGIKRTNCMAFLMIPTLAFYLAQYYTA